MGIDKNLHKVAKVPSLKTSFNSKNFLVSLPAVFIYVPILILGCLLIKIERGNVNHTHIVLLMLIKFRILFRDLVVWSFTLYTHLGILSMGSTGIKCYHV